VARFQLLHFLTDPQTLFSTLQSCSCVMPGKLQLFRGAEKLIDKTAKERYRNDANCIPIVPMQEFVFTTP
jgi:hypothetical protein